MHGAPDSSARHVGDFGNIESSGGSAIVTITDSLAKLTGNPNNSVSTLYFWLMIMSQIELSIDHGACYCDSCW